MSCVGKEEGQLSDASIHICENSLPDKGEKGKPIRDKEKKNDRASKVKTYAYKTTLLRMCGCVCVFWGGLRGVHFSNFV